ncbi:DUF4365 domain-containing protein [Mycobacterium intracellulare]|uniref:DUF4365 domain-containing protein n=1 Tax=Mycobacterium intracellulare TaxID=1767 RepID=UPI000694C3B9|nr:DUF4365 domain-containing protein [Mycobacterium intracellulare]MEE3805008.1 DUF4365 domain-containing protein [Mycobacterium intracellulare]OBG12833.1 hypothetical protein A5769_02120 [Mycobacterium intracellulare]UQB85571.1 DUF4365 domain-containing protein [Mycobacterium intracellulare]UQC09185.1 DUF4365 domain-containing protein [Mycobacterium intracellulare ATCC 13950]BCO46431.1 hypothetical protein MINTM002_21050 [Mycobacterium intracellulare]
MAAAQEGEDVLPAVVRGSPSRIDEMMEAFQEAYVRGVAAAAGCVVGAPEIDEGVDVTLTHTSDIHLRDDKKAHLEVQMKSSAYGPIENGQFVSTSLKRARYDEFRAVDVAVHKIIVILHMPVLQEDWLTVGADALHLHHRAYWVSIRGMPPIPNAQQASFTVRAPTVQVFDDITLCHIMQRIGQKGAP